MYVMFTFAPHGNGGGAFPDASPTMHEICGIAPEEVRNDAAPLFRRIEPDDLARLRRAIAQGTREQTAWDVEFGYRHPSKGLVWMRARCTPLTGAHGRRLQRADRRLLLSRRSCADCRGVSAARLTGRPWHDRDQVQAFQDRRADLDELQCVYFERRGRPSARLCDDQPEHRY